jgi:hypothetical protein
MYLQMTVRVSTGGRDALTAAVEALWVGERPTREQAVTPAELAALARAGALGTRALRRVRRARGLTRREPNKRSRLDWG